MDLQDHFNELKEAALELAKNEFKDYYEDAKKDIETFLKESEIKLKDWGVALLFGEITKEEVKMLLLSEKDLFTLELLKQAGIQQIKLNKFKDNLFGLIIDKLE